MTCGFYAVNKCHCIPSGLNRSVCCKAINESYVFISKKEVIKKIDDLETELFYFRKLKDSGVRIVNMNEWDTWRVIAEQKIKDYKHMLGQETPRN